MALTKSTVAHPSSVLPRALAQVLYQAPLTYQRLVTSPNALAVLLEVGSLPHSVSIKVTDETMPSGLGISGSPV
jgi:hypothetical protein